MIRRAARDNRGIAVCGLLLMAPEAFAQRPGVAQRAAPVVETTFAATVARLSEPSGFFDTDNLIHDLRDNLIDYLIHNLMYRARFERSRNRMEYLCRWLGRPIPADIDAWTERSINDLVGYLARTSADSGFAINEQRALLALAVRTGIPLSHADRATIARVHSTFVREGLELRFTSFGRRPRWYYPTLSQLMLERDADGRMASYLAARRQVVSAVYTSNVEFYLWGDGSFGRFAATVAALPHDSRSVILRSYYGAQRWVGGGARCTGSQRLCECATPSAHRRLREALRRRFLALG